MSDKKKFLDAALKDLPTGDKPTIVWLRNDLRVADNPALLAAASRGNAVICLYILENDTRPLGGARQWWLHHSLMSLANDLEALGGSLVLRRGKASEIVPSIMAQSSADTVLWNRRYDKEGMAIDTALKQQLGDANLCAKSFKANLLFEPWEVESKSGGYYRVYTPFKRACFVQGPARGPLPKPDKLTPTHDIASDRLNDWKLLPTKPDWAVTIGKIWKPGSKGAQKNLTTFLNGADTAKPPIGSYKQARDLPAIEGTSRLSPHLAFGEISPYQIWSQATDPSVETPDLDRETFLSEILWREFSYTLLFHNPDLASKNYSDKFNAFPWKQPDADTLKRWQTGQTGYPIVDAGMRQLWQTGWMHNRVRMIVGSFLVKHLLLHWSHGEEWFWDTLVDADPASNAASWQWVAGSGADAAPYFRIFNPITQGEKFDPKGVYIRHFVPELSKLSDKYLNKPWEAPESMLKSAGVVLGDTYPHPIVDHSDARKRALAAFNETKETA